MNRNSRIWWIATTLWMISFPCQAEPAEIRVRLHAYVAIPPSALNQAKEVASSVLRQAGIRVSWAECSTQEVELSKDSTCREPFTALDLQMRIVGKAMERRSATSSECLGYALATGGFSSIAAAYYHRVVELEGSGLASQGAILGGIIAHEIGHLLGIKEHTAEGLMRADWRAQDLKALTKGWFCFTGDEASRIAAAVAKRADEKTSGH